MSRVLTVIVFPYPALAFTIGSPAQLIAPKIADAVVTRVVGIIWMPIMWEASMICWNN